MVTEEFQFLKEKCKHLKVILFLKIFVIPLGKKLSANWSLKLSYWDAKLWVFEDDPLYWLNKTV